MEVILTALPILAFLACPIVMAFCVFRMRRSESDALLPTVVEDDNEQPSHEVVRGGAHATPGSA